MQGQFSFGSILCTYLAITFYCGLPSWQNATLPNGKEKLQKLSFQGSFDAFSELKLQTPTFLMHHFVKEKQSAAFKMDHDFSDTNFDTAVLQNDFAENYSQMG